MNYEYSTDYFIEKATKAHGNKYDYSKVVYKKASEKVEIICKTHGSFYQRPLSHYKGSGCPICGQIKRARSQSSTTEQFIAKAKLVHGDKYDYSKVVYKNSSTKVEIICRKHGSFLQAPYSTLAGNGCKKCDSKSREISESAFIEKANKIHNNKYDYSLVIYKDTTHKVKIICPIHGEFEQLPRYHLKSQGCLICAHKQTGRKTSIKVKNNYIDSGKIDILLKRFHGELYKIVSLENYINYRSKIKLSCPNHGLFEIAISQIARGYACPKCLKEKERIKSQNIFIEKSKMIHNNFYIYDKTYYIEPLSKVIIICPLHGDFSQKAASHCIGIGCPTCKASKLEKSTEHWLKASNISFIRQKKFSECKNIYELPFDFYLPDYNICIECDGNQHEDLEHFTMFMNGRAGIYDSDIILKEYEALKVRDIIKTNYCSSNNIYLLRIPYKELKHINEYLDKRLLPLVKA